MRFFERPQHQDFWKLSNIIMATDVQCEDGRLKFPEVIDQYVDPDSLAYIAQHRMVRAMQELAPLAKDLTPENLSALMTIWMDGFHLGCAYQDLSNEERAAS